MRPQHLLFFALTLALQTFPSWAEPPLLIKDLNTPGRRPYEAQIEFFSSGCSRNCTNFLSFGSVLLFDGPPVPAGKRLVIEWVSAELPANNVYNSISLQSSRIIANQSVKWQYFGPFFQTSPENILHGMSSAAFTTYGPGEAPHIRLQINSINNYFANITISGYLIKAN